MRTRFISGLMVFLSLACGSPGDVEDGGSRAWSDAGADGSIATPRPDGGIDAGGFDAGGFDAGGFDAGGFDAGAQDAGAQDASALDTGSATIDTPLAAFVGAEGAGAISVGGRGARVLQVTTLDDSNEEGTLRWALTREFPRVVVFRVAGTIMLNSRLDVRGQSRSFLTVAGQTAPGGGITIGGATLRFREMHDVVLRYVRLRFGPGARPGADDGFWGMAIERFVADHVSISWAGDEAISITTTSGLPCADITVQRCLMAEAHPDHNTGSIMGTGSTTNPADLVGAFSVHHNLYTHISHRFPNLGSNSRFEVINNVIHNWRARLVNLRYSPSVDIVNNYYQRGPVTPSDVSQRLHKYNLGDSSAGEVYIAGNLIMPGIETDPNADNWWHMQVFIPFGEFQRNDPLEIRFRRLRALDPSPVPIEITSAAEAFRSVLDDVGANARVLGDGSFVSNLDTLDTQYLQDVRTAGGPAAYRGPELWQFPVIDPGSPYRDEDADGMGDEWESAQGLSATDPEDGASDRDGDGYTNLEEFLNGTLP